MKTCPSCHQALADDALFCPIDGTPLASVESDPLLGSIIADRYVLLERVGQGNSGTIYRAEHVVLRQSIAVKLLHPQLSQDQAAVERFREEVTTLALLKSNSIVRGSDFGVTEDGRIFFAMEYLEGETLAATLGREGRFTEARALGILEQIGGALAEAHKLGFVHRDIRPRNIFLIKEEEQEQIKLLDFGLAKLAEPQKGAKPSATSIGDPRYMSPEQARGDVADARGDIYSLAIIAYELVTGNPPFVGAGTLDVLTKHLEAQPVPIKNKASDISVHFADSVAFALRKRAKDRYSTVTRFLDALAGREPVDDPAVGSGGMRKHRLTPSGQLPRIAPAAAKVAPAKPATAATTPPVTKAAENAPGATLIGTGLKAAEVIAAAKKLDQQVPTPASVTSAEERPAESSPAVGKKASRKAKKAMTAKGKAGAPGQEAPSQAAKGAPSQAAKAASSPPAKATSAADPASDTVVSAAPVAAATAESGAGDDFEERATHKIELQPPKEEAKASDAVDSGADDQASGSVDTSTPLASAPLATSTVTAVSQPSFSSATNVVIKSDRPQGADISSPEFSLSKVTPSEESSYQEEQLSQSTNWFAEGMAAEKQLATTTKSGPLPSIYSTMNDEDEELPNRFSPAVVIGIVVGVTAIFLLGFIFMFTGEDEEAVAAATPPAEHKQKNAAEVKSAFAAAGEGKPSPASEAPVKAKGEEENLTQDPKPQAVALPDKVADPAPDIKDIAPKTAKVEPPPKKKAPPPPKAAPKPASKPAPKPAPKAASKPAPRSKPRSKPRAAPAKPASNNKPAAKPSNGAALAKAEARAGQNSLKRGDYTRAKQSFTKALQLDPRNAAAHAGLGELAFEQGKYAAASGHLRRALQYSPRNSRTIVMLGNAYFKQKKTKDAVAQYRKALKINPNNAAARAGLEASIRRLAGS